MRYNDNNSKKYKKSFFQRIIDFFRISDDSDAMMTSEEAEQFEKDFGKLRCYKTGEGKREWYVKGR